MAARSYVTEDLTSKTSIIVSLDWLKAQLSHGSPDIKLLDCTWYMPGTHSPAIDDWKKFRIKDSLYFDIDEIADQSKLPLPHMVPSHEQFANQVSALGLSNTDHIICYDRTGQYMASARVWWLFRLFGHSQVSVLSKGLSDHDLDDVRFLIQTEPPDSAPTKGNFIASPRHNTHLKTMSQILENIQTKQFQIVDARSAARFNAEVKETRPNLQSGHIPGAFNVPFTSILKDREILHRDELYNIFKASGLDLEKPIVTSCGSGVTAAVLSLALAKLNIPSALYDGSWAEYGQEKLSNPVDPKKSKL
jgi:thiosulfate/3-mercaptopyruvate sulfurtransferase